MRSRQYSLDERRSHATRVVCPEELAFQGFYAYSDRGKIEQWGGGDSAI